MLFNPRTENNDYIILAPAIGYYLANMVQHKKIFQQFILIMICIGFVGDYYFSSLFILEHHNWFSPLMGLSFMAIYLPSLWLNQKTENINANNLLA